MKRLIYTGMAVALSLLLLTVLSLKTNNTALATEARLIKIQPVGNDMDNVTGVAIDPQTVHIKKNTVVIWMNGVPLKQIQVVFQEGKACKDVTANPRGFSLNRETSCYVTSYIPYGDTSTLQFPQAGTFFYVVQTPEGKFKAKGEIDVK